VLHRRLPPVEEVEGIPHAGCAGGEGRAW
jgi:hypothetical protein